MASFKNKTFEGYSLDELADKYTDVFLFKSKLSHSKPLNETIKDDDNLQSKLWTEAYKSAGFYFDHPTQRQRDEKFSSFRYNFSSLLKETKNLNELPEVNSRKDLLTWVCKKHNEFLELKSIEERVNCDYNFLSKLYGYDDCKVHDIVGSGHLLKY